MKWRNVATVVGLSLCCATMNAATAADLGGNCCADLEERIAELEATTARKGNRKVSLTVSGWVTQNVMWWDDGFESNTYVYDTGSTIASHVKFTGQATITPGWTAGYVLHLEALNSDGGLGLDQETANGPSLYTGAVNGVQTLQSYWFIKSDALGKVSVGLQSHASDNTSILVDGSGSLIPANNVQFDYGGFFLRDASGAFIANGFPFAGDNNIFKNNLTISNAYATSDFNGTTTNSVRYDTPTFAGFSASASWGEDDFWDVAVRYAGEFSGFKVSVAAAYAEATDSPGSQFPLLSVLGDAEHFQIGGYLQHVPTGLFIYSSYADADLSTDPATINLGDLEAQNWYIKAGIRQRWTSLGHTVLYGEYQEGEIEFAAGGAFSDHELWGLGVVQEIDAAAMSLWLTYRDFEMDVPALGAGVGADIHYVKAGALIAF